MEKASKHKCDNKIRNSPHSGIFIASSNIAMNLKKISLSCKIFLFSATIEKV